MKEPIQAPKRRGRPKDICP
jgi:hypothetical protein